jgi:branched-chain amino acid transport system ATP-binding protein
MTILLVEQNARAALKLASEAYLLETGRIVLHGPVDDFNNNENVRRSYLGY